MNNNNCIDSIRSESPETTSSVVIRFWWQCYRIEMFISEKKSISCYYTMITNECQIYVY